MTTGLFCAVVNEVQTGTIIMKSKSIVGLHYNIVYIIMNGRITIFRKDESYRTIKIGYI